MLQWTLCMYLILVIFYHFKPKFKKKSKFLWSECKEMVSVLRPGRGQTSTAAPLNVMARWWETELQGAPGWLELRRDVIAGCTRLIDDWPCCWVARDDGHEARSCTAATVSCSPLLLCLSWLVLHYFSLLYFVSLPCFLSESFDPVSLLLFFCVFSLSVFFLCLSLRLSLFVAGWLLQACCCLLGLLHYFLSENAAECLLKKGETLNFWALSR